MPIQDLERLFNMKVNKYEIQGMPLEQASMKAKEEMQNDPRVINALKMGMPNAVAGVGYGTTDTEQQAAAPKSMEDDVNEMRRLGVASYKESSSMSPILQARQQYAQMKNDAASIPYQLPLKGYAPPTYFGIELNRRIADLLKKDKITEQEQKDIEAYRTSQSKSITLQKEAEKEKKRSLGSKDQIDYFTKGQEMLEKSFKSSTTMGGVMTTQIDTNSWQYLSDNAARAYKDDTEFEDRNGDALITSAIKKLYSFPTQSIEKALKEIGGENVLLANLVMAKEVYYDRQTVGDTDKKKYTKYEAKEMAKADIETQVIAAKQTYSGKTPTLESILRETNYPAFVMGDFIANNGKDKVKAAINAMNIDQETKTAYLNFVENYKE